MHCRTLPLIAFLALIPILAPLASAQNGWVQQPAPVFQDLEGVDFIDARTGWACGFQGTILHTDDGGTTWIAQTSNTTAGLYAISFADAHLGLAVGDGGTILRTTDGGDSWVIIREGWMDTLYGVHAFNSRLAVVVGENPLFAPYFGRSTDGGQTWTWGTFYIQNNEAALTDVQFVSETVGFCTAAIWDGRGAVCRSTNGGQSWTPQVIDANAMSCIDMSSALAGSAGGMNGRILRTTNGGTSWTTQFNGNGRWIHGISFPSDAIGFCAGDAGAIARTENGGTTWSQQTSGVPFPLRHLDFVDTSNGTAVGQLATILHTTTGGLPPSAVASGAPAAARLRLLAQRPNPFRGSTEFLFETQRAGMAALEIFDLLGRRVRSLSLSVVPGSNACTWDGTDDAGRIVAGGTYFCRLRGADDVRDDAPGSRVLYLGRR